MRYQTEYALQQARMDELMPIRSSFDGSYYTLTSAKGDKRHIGAGSANTAWANADWPHAGKWAVLWRYATPLGKKK